MQHSKTSKVPAILGLHAGSEAPSSSTRGKGVELVSPDNILTYISKLTGDSESFYFIDKETKTQVEGLLPHTVATGMGQECRCLIS